MTKTKRSDESKAFEKRLRGMRVGSAIRFRRGEGDEASYITFVKDDEFTIRHTQGRGAMHYSVGIKDCADWWTTDDGEGPWVEVTM